MKTNTASTIANDAIAVIEGQEIAYILLVLNNIGLALGNYTQAISSMIKFVYRSIIVINNKQKLEKSATGRLIYKINNS